MKKEREKRENRDKMLTMRVNKSEEELINRVAKATGINKRKLFIALLEEFEKNNMNDEQELRKFAEKVNSKSDAKKKKELIKLFKELLDSTEEVK